MQPCLEADARRGLKAEYYKGRRFRTDDKVEERLDEQRIVQQIDLADRQVVGRAPVGVDQLALGCVVHPTQVRRNKHIGWSTRLDLLRQS